MKTDYKFVEYGRFSSEFEYSQLFQLCIEKMEYKQALLVVNCIKKIMWLKVPQLLLLSI